MYKGLKKSWLLIYVIFLKCKITQTFVLLPESGEVKPVYMSGRYTAFVEDFTDV